jgi:hypothetical protein
MATQAYSTPKGIRGVRRNATLKILIACSIICTAADFQTRLTAEKYPDKADDIEIAGSENDIILKGFTALESFSHKTDIGFANEKSNMADPTPKEREYMMHFRIAAFTSFLFSPASATHLVAARLIPDVARVSAKPHTFVTSE